MKELTLNYKLSRNEYIDIQTYFMIRKSNIVKICLALFVIGVVLVAAELITGAGISGEWVLLVFPFPYIGYVIFKIKNIAYGMYSGDIKEWKVCFGSSGIKATAVKQKKDMEISWEAVCKVWKGKKYVYLFFSKSVFLAIPLRAVEDKEEFNRYIGMADGNSVI